MVTGPPSIADVVGVAEVAVTFGVVGAAAGVRLVAAFWMALAVELAAEVGDDEPTGRLWALGVVATTGVLAASMKIGLPAEAYSAPP